MRRTLAIAVASFSAGLVLGVFATSHLWVVTSRILRDSTLAEYEHEQLLRASRAERSGDAFRRVLHTMNAADAQAEIGFRWLQRSRSDTYGTWFWFPWLTFPLVPHIEVSSTKYEKGRRYVEAAYRAQAAVALEQFGRPDLAAEQWNLARELRPEWPQEKHRKYVSDHPFLYDEAQESAYLDSGTSEELSNALERMQRSRYVSE